MKRFIPVFPIRGGPAGTPVLLRLRATDGRRGGALLDLGEVRGCADVTVNGTSCATLVWGL